MSIEPLPDDADIDSVPPLTVADTQPQPVRAQPRLSAAFGGGGPFGIAYGLGVVDALRECGVVFEGAPLLGTSAGSWVAACLATGIGHEELRQVPPPRVPNWRRGLLAGIARSVFGAARSDLVTASAVRLPAIGRVLLSGGDHDLADLVAASSAVPGLFAPAPVGRAFYVDGGVRSLVSADRARPADHLLVVAPIAGPMFGPGGRSMEAMLRTELRRWRRRTGGATHLIRPNARIAALTRHPLELFDREKSLEVYPMAQAQVFQLLASGRLDLTDLLDPPAVIA